MELLNFDWNNENLGHLARHEIAQLEAEQVVFNRPIDIESHLRDGEERVVQIGETNSGRVLVIVSTMRDGKVRVITGWPANQRFRRYFLTQKRNGNVGRIEEQDLRE